MKLEQLSRELLEQALRIYLELAYESGELPPWARIDTSDLESPTDVIGLFSLEAPPNPGGEIHPHYVMRLGNSLYPHMKMALMEFCEPGEWFWAVDTHDSAPVREDSSDWPLWQRVRRHNLHVKARVEEAWRIAGIPTARVVAEQFLPECCDGSGPLVLVVDDEEGMRTAAVNILRGDGYRVIEASSGFEALELVESLHPDAVVMDFEMPGMDGVEVCRRLRDREDEHGDGRHTPVLLATAGQVRLSETKGADGFLMKPYHHTLLLSFVAHQLPGKKGGTAGERGPGVASD